jgi:glycosyltransferase involved in cell wall biosynthesis
MRMPKIVVIPQGVNQEFYSLEGKKKKYDLISIGTFTNRKGHFFLVDVIEKLNEIIPNITLAIIGSKCESTYFNELLGRIKKNDLEKCISLFPDLSFKDTLEILDQSGIFVLHSQEESQGIALCEAMAAGKPIVSTKVGGIPDVIEHGINGLLSEYGEVDIFTNNILTILTNKKYYESIALNNRTKSLKYKWDTIANDILDTYNQII